MASTPFRIGAIRTPIMTSDCAMLSPCPESGVAIEASIMVCKYLDLNCQFSWASDPLDYGQSLNGTWTGLLGDLMMGRFDASVPIFFPTEIRHKGIDFSNPCFYFDHIFITRMSQQDLPPLDFGMIFAFSWRVWLCVIVCCFILGLVVSIMEKSTPSSIEYRLDRLLHCSMKAFQYIGGREHNKRPFRTSKSRLLFTLWGIISIVLSGAYTGTMFCNHLTNRSVPPFTDLPTLIQCLHANKCRLIFTPFQNYIMDRLIWAVKTDPVGSNLDLTNDRITQVNSSRQLFDQILNDSRAYWVTVELTSIFHVYSNYNWGHRYYTLESPFKDIGAFALPKGSPYLEKINRATRVLFDNAAGLALMKKYIPDWSSAVWAQGPSHDGKTGMTVYTGRSFYIFYGIGICLAWLAFAVEIFYARIYH